MTTGRRARRLAVVVNPEARGEPARAAIEVADLARAAGWEVRQELAEIRGHGFLLSQQAVAEGAEMVLAVGGDGTVREVVAGLAGTSVPLAIATAGSGNSSYRELFGEAPWQATLASVLAGHRLREVDLIEVAGTGEVALMGFSGGWFAQIVALAEGVSAVGAARYAEAAGLAAAAPARFAARVRADGRILFDGEVGLLALGGARVRASVFPVFPGSQMDDGLLEVLVVEATDTAGFNDLLGAVVSGTHLAHPLAHHVRATRVEVVAPGGFRGELDGDLMDREYYDIALRCLPGRLTVAVPA